MPWHYTAAAVALAALGVLVSAKAHGRQVRLVRERAGIHEVEFGGTNPPLVEALWQKDRVRFWTAYPVLAAAAALAYVAACPCAAVPWGAVLLAAGPWAFSAAFFVAGLPHLPEAAPADARPSVAWWCAAAACVAASVVVAALAGP